MEDRIKELERLVKLLCDKADLCINCKDGFYIPTGMASYPPLCKCDNCDSIKPDTEEEQKYSVFDSDIGSEDDGVRDLGFGIFD